MFRRFKSFLSFALTALAVSASASIPAFQPLEATVPMVGRPSATEQFVYDALGNRIGFYNAEGKPITFGFDAQGRVTAITNAIGKVTSFAYDVNGNLTDRTDAKNEITHYDYNALNRLTNVVHEGQWKAAFGCDANGNLLNQQSAIANQQFSYDSMNRLRVSTQSVYSVSSVVQNSYDLNGNRTNIVYPGGLNVGYSYDAENRLTSVTAKNAQITKTFAFGYDGASRLASISYPNGVNSSFGYDAESRVTNYVHGTFLNHTITRDPRGFKTREDISQGLVPTITNSLRQTRTHNDADQLTAVENLQSPIGNQQFSYDPNGGLTNSSGVTFGWSYDNRLISVSGGSNSTSTVYLYDASGARVGRIANGVTNYFVVDYAGALKRPLAETDASGNITRYYIWAGFQLLAHIEANGTVRYYHGDELGSTLALTDEAGTATDQFAYAPYGELLSRTGTNSTAFLWLGGYGVYHDSAADLHLTLRRAYSAEQKRFISADPKGIDGGANLYAYGDLNPLAFVDPYGLCADSGYQTPSWENYTPGLSSPRTMNAAQYEANATLTLGAGFRPDSPIASTMADFNASLYQQAVISYVGAAASLAAKSEIFQTGVNVTPRSVANEYRTIGQGGRTFVTEPSAVEDIVGSLNRSRIDISPQQARQLENALGLNANSLETRNIISVIDDIPSRAPGSPITGNSLFQGGGTGLPGGGSELTIQGIPSAGGPGIRQIILGVGNR